MSETIRAFVAIALPDDVIARIGALQEDLRAEGLNFRWVRPQNIHLTLKFLGDISFDRVSEIEEMLLAAAVGQARPEIAAKGIGVFPTVKKPRVIWVGVSGQTERLRMLQQTIEGHLAEAGFASE